MRPKAGAAALFGALLALSAAAAEAGGRFDGRWAIFIYGPPGPCALGYRLPLSISGQRVLYKGREVSRAAISLNAAGGVAIRLGRDPHVVVGTGSLMGQRGSGKWVAPSFSCKGIWYAKRL